MGGTGSVRVGIAWMVLATVQFITMDTLSKLLSAHYPLNQVAWSRFFFHTVLVVLVLAPRLRTLLVTRRLGVQILRSGLLLGVTLLSFTSLRSLPLMLVTAVTTLTPVMVTALSVPLLKEKVGWRRWSGVALGFVGAMVVVGPAAVSLSLIVLVPLGMALFNALYMIATRFLRDSDPPLTTLLFTGVVGTIGLTPTLAFEWVAPDLTGWVMMVALGTLGAASHYCMILSYTAAPASVVAPFAYLTLVWATVLGIVVFGEVPSLSTIAGSLLIAGSGLYIFYREQVRGVRSATA